MTFVYNRLIGLGTDVLCYLTAAGMSLGIKVGCCSGEVYLQKASPAHNNRAQPVLIVQCPGAPKLLLHQFKSLAIIRLTQYVWAKRTGLFAGFFVR